MNLYPRREEPLSEALFRSPTREYRGAPFWAWNCEIDPQVLDEQIDTFKKMGMGGFHIHVRTGMATPYLSDAFMALVRHCLDKADSCGLLTYLYDEDRWPSGAAGGTISNPALFLLRSRSEAGIRCVLQPRTPTGPVCASSPIRNSLPAAAVVSA